MTQLDTGVIAAEAIELQRTINGLVADLDVKKDQLRTIANGDILKLTVPNMGTVSVTRPREGGVKTGTRIKFNEDRLSLIPELKQKLLDKGIIVEEDIISTAAVASVTIKPNV